MKNNVYKNLCGHIDYDTYKKMREIGTYLPAGLSLLGIVSTLSAFHSPENLIVSWGILGGIKFLFSDTFKKGGNYTKDVKEIRDLYTEFLHNYNKLNDIFHLNNPVEISTMFEFLLFNGYLSKDKEFQALARGSDDKFLFSVRGAEVFTGKGVCKHIASMFSDILNEYGIESSPLVVYINQENLNLDIDSLEQQGYSDEELVNQEGKKIIFNLDVRSFILDYMSKISGNHMISYAFKDGKSYFLDPSNDEIFRMKESKRVLYNEFFGDIPIRFKFTKLYCDLEHYSRMKKRLSKPYLSITQEEEKLIDETLDKCENNMNIFEQFYADNRELYKEISQKVLTLRNQGRKK